MPPSDRGCQRPFPPHKIEFDFVEVIDHAVTHSGDSLPGNLRMGQPKFGREPLDTLTHDHDVLQKGGQRLSR